MKKRLVKIGIYSFSPIVIGGIALGLVFGLKKRTPEIFVIDDSQEVKYFHDEIIPKGMQNAFLFPKKGHNLLDKFILLDKKVMEKNLFISKMMKNTPKNQKGIVTPEKIIQINFSTLNGMSKIDNALNDANKQLWDFANESNNKAKRWGIYWNSNKNNDSIFINVYKLDNENQNDKNILDNYVSALNSSKAPSFNDWVNDYVLNSNLTYGDNKKLSTETKVIDFVNPIQSALSLKSNQMMFNFPFVWKESANDTSKKGKNLNLTDKTALFEKVITTTTNPKIDTKDKKGDNAIGKLIWSDGLSVPYKGKYSNKSLNSMKLNFNKDLIENKIISTVKPYYEFSNDGSKKSLLKILISFYKLGKSSQIDFTSSNDIVKNPENIYTRTIEFDWNQVLNDISKKGESNSVSNTPDNQETVFKSINEEWLNYVSIGIVREGLSLLSIATPEIESKIKSLLDTFGLLKKIKNKNIKIDNKDAFSYILKEKYGKSQKNVIDRIIDKMNSADYVQAATIFHIWFKDFKGDKNSQWTDISTFMNINNIVANNLKDLSSAKKVYYFYAGANLFEPIIRKRIEQLVQDNKINNYYDTIEENTLQAFIGYLKKEEIIKNNDFEYSDLTNETKRNELLASIIQAIIDGKKINVPKELFGALQVGDYIPIINAVINKDFTPDLLKLLVGNDTAKKALNDILADPLNQIIARLKTNIPKNKDMAQKAFAKVIDSLSADNNGGITSIKQALDLNTKLASLDKKYQPLINGLINGFKTQTDFLNSFSFIEPGIIHDFLLGQNGSGGILGDIYNNVSNIILSPFVNKNENATLSNILKNGIKKSSKSDVAKFINIMHKVLSGGLVSAIPGAGDTIGTISTLFDVVSPLPSNPLAPSAVNLKFASLVKELF